jgi:hypothetical protein
MQKGFIPKSVRQDSEVKAIFKEVRKRRESRKCVKCGQEYRPNAPHQKYCHECSKHPKKYFCLYCGVELHPLLKHDNAYGQKGIMFDEWRFCCALHVALYSSEGARKND